MKLACLALGVLGALLVPTRPIAPVHAPAHASAATQDGPSLSGTLLNAVPKDATVLVSAPDLAAMSAALEANAWGRLLADPQMVQLRTWFKDQDRDLEAILDLFGSARGELAFFIGGGLAAAPDWALLIEPGEGADEFLSAADHLALITDEDTASVSHRGVHIYLGQEDPPTEIMFDFQVGPVWCMGGAPTATQADDLAKTLIDRLLDGGEPGIESNPMLKAARAGAAPGQVELFVDLQSLVGKFAPSEGELASEDFGRLWGLLGMDQLSWAHGTVAIGEGEELTAELRMPSPATGYIRDWLDMLGPFDPGLAGITPADAASGMYYNFDYFAFYESCWDLFSDLTPELYDQYRGMYEAALASMGDLDLEGELLMNLTGELAQIAMPVSAAEFAAVTGLPEDEVDIPESLTLGTLTAIGLEDREAVEWFLEEAIESLGGYVGIGSSDIESETLGQSTIHSLELPSGQTIAWSFTDGAVLGTLYPSLLPHVLPLTEQGSTEGSLLEDERFSPLLAAHPAAGSLSVMPSARAISIALGAAGVILPSIAAREPWDGGDEAFWSNIEGGDDVFWSNVDGGDDVAWDFSALQLPSADIATRYLKGNIASTIAHKDGLLTVSVLSR